MQPGDGSDNVVWTPDLEDNVSYGAGVGAGATDWTDVATTPASYAPGDNADSRIWDGNGVDLVNGLLIETEGVYFADIHGVRIILEEADLGEWTGGSTVSGVFTPGDGQAIVTW